MKDRDRERESLRIINARENNLKGVSVEIPHDTLTVVTGLSGSGKSSLAFDTVYAEGQRRYIETFSTYTRQFFDKVKKPELDGVERVRPAIAIEQRTRVLNSRSTVGSMTDLNDYLKILWANLAKPVCPECGVTLRKWSAQDIAELLVRWNRVKQGRTFLIAAKIPLPSGTARQGVIDRLRTLGYPRLFDQESGTIHTIIDDSPLPKSITKADSFLVVLDRVRGQPDEKRIRESAEQAFSLSDKSCSVVELLAADEGSPRPWLAVSHSGRNERASPFRVIDFHAAFACDEDRISIPKPRPALFSFNHPLGACPTCRGFGRVLTVDPEKCVPDPRKSIREKALHCWAGDGARIEFKRLLKFCEGEGIPTEIPWREITEEDRNKIFTTKSRAYIGVRPWFARKERKAYKMHVRVFLARFRGDFICESCSGTRLQQGALVFRVRGITIADCVKKSLGELSRWIHELREEVASSALFTRSLREIFDTIEARLSYLLDLGLSYLTLERQARTLSGGETQRVNLATALGSELIRTEFVLDEPSVGLHPRDTERLITSLSNLASKGNSVLVVEHDLEIIDSADHIIEMGPRAGAHGGEVVFSGERSEWKGITPLPARVSRMPVPLAQEPRLTISRATANNLKNISLSIPLGRFVCLTGVSGSGKTTLVNEVVRRGYERYTMGQAQTDENSVSGFEHVQQVLLVDQSPLAKTPRANIATYTKMWDTIRERLASLEAAKIRKLSKSSFSFNVDAGRCTACGGAGFIREDMQFLSDVYLPCEECLGKRFQPLVLEVAYKGKNVDDLLSLSVESCVSFFDDEPHLSRIAHSLTQLGLGHLRLGHPLSELSGGEAQRLKLVPFLEKSVSGKALLIFDEPTTGLHLHDVERLLDVFTILRDQGHSLLCVEHNIPLISSADWVIDLGPEAGTEGGRIIAEGTPSELASLSISSSHTAKYLREYMRPQTKQRVRKESDKRISTQPRSITIRGAREHNLKNVDLDVPLGSLVAITGVSGSGKSTIAKDIIYAEGQRRYLDCLSPYARQYIKELQKPDIDSIENITPTVCVYQHTFQPSSLSTVGTMSEVYNFLRLLYAKCGVQHCPDHPSMKIAASTSEEIADSILALKGRNIRLLAPIISGKKGHHKQVFARAVELEIHDVRVDGVYGSPSKFNEGLERHKVHSIEFVVARFASARIDRELVIESVSQALSLGGGTLIIDSDGELSVVSTERACPECGRGFLKPDPEDFSFNSKRGACAECGGYGRDESGAACDACEGTRIQERGRHVRIGGKSIYEASLLAPPALESFLRGLTFSGPAAKLAEPILSEVFSKLATLSRLGLHDIALARECTSLAGGELQRLRLATAMGTPLSGVLYILDEPSAGLHPVDNQLVLSHLRALNERGNSVLLIEHDPETILFSDYVIDVGPGGGREGGRIVYSGPTTHLKKAKESETARSIFHGTRLESSKKEGIGRLQICGSAHNVKDISLSIPLGTLTTIAGVSGAGKSSLLHGIICDTLLGDPPIKGKGNTKTEWMRGKNRISSTLPIDRVLIVDQKPIGKNSRSTPVSYLGVWDDIRRVFSESLDAKARGWTPSFFSHNTGKGRCAECAGQGRIKLEMGFLAEAWVTCEVCEGSRYSDHTLEIRYRGYTIGDILRLTFDEARSVFANHRKIHELFHHTCELGLGYLTLGQNSATLSGGESQRIKLVSELGASRAGHTLYVLDEPTTGLHKSDVARLVKSLHSLVAKGNTIITIEHDSDVLLASDWVVEIGPGAGARGGKVVFEGAPSRLPSASTPWGKLLSRMKEPSDEPRITRWSANV